MRTRHHFRAQARFSLKEIRAAVREVEGVNAKIAVAITRGVGTMACAYAFAALALVSLPAAIQTGQTIIIVAWIAQTFLQLVLLSIIMVGQKVLAAASDERSERMSADVERILKALDATAASGDLGQEPGTGTQVPPASLP